MLRRCREDLGVKTEMRTREFVLRAGLRRSGGGGLEKLMEGAAREAHGTGF